MKRILAVFLALTFIFTNSQAAFCQKDAPAGLEEMRAIGKLLSDGKTLAALRIAETAAEEIPMIGEELATFRSFVGDAQGALAAMDKALPARSPEAAPEPGLFEGFTPHPAVSRIIELARDRRIVIINEGHHVPRHRAFTHQLLQGLRDSGYSYFAAEAFSGTGQLKDRGYPLRENGYYLHEPVFGDLVRQSLKLGFDPVAYESMGFGAGNDVTDQINARETGQCRNLMDRIFSKDPDAKVLIHVGYSHATEDTVVLPDGRERLWMAARLAKATGLDPLTIDQTGQSPRSTVESSPLVWKMACEEFELDSPVVLEAADGSFLVTGDWAGKVDIQVFHPPVNDKIGDGRPDWLVKDGFRQLVDIPEAIQAQENGRLLVQAYIDEESDDAIPFDCIVLDPDLPRPKLALRAGRFRIVTQDESGEKVHGPITLEVPQISDTSRDK